MILLEPIRGVENLIYIGYANDPSSAIHITRGRCLDRKKKDSERNVFQCFVFGPKEAGKTSLLHSFVGSPFVEVYTPTTERRYAVNVVDQPGGKKKTLILREITEDTIEMLMAKNDTLAACDIAVFVYDSSNENSWVKATKLLVKIANRGKSTGYEVPCVIVAAKDDLRSYLTVIRDSMRVSLDFGVEAPVPISTKLGELNNIFLIIARAAEHPHLSIPETDIVKTQKHYHKLLNRSLTVVSVGAAAAVVGLAAYRVYKKECLILNQPT